MNEETQQKMCSSKVRYVTEMQANYAIGRAQVVHSDMKDKKMRTYKCPFCHGFHITTREFDGYTVKMRLRMKS